MAEVDPLSRSIVASLSGGVLATDMDGRILLANPAAEQHLGLPRDALAPGARIHAIEALAPFRALFERLLDERRTVTREEIELIVGGTPRVLGVTASLLRDEIEDHGVVFSFTDLTRIRELERAAELNRQLAQIGELTAGVVHEIRNPLSVIGGMAELLQRQLPDDSALREKSQIIVQEVESLERMVRDFLSFSKTHRLEKLPCSTETLIDRVRRQSERLAREHGVQLEIRAFNAPPQFTGDLSKLVQALGNLIRNAIEVSPEGGSVTLGVRKHSKGVLFEVEDQGPGIHLQPGENIFSPFVTSRDGGTGLGLSIVHRIVTAHEGEIAHENRKEGGARFEVWLPA